MRSGRSKCSKCPSQFINSIRILGFLAMILGMIWFVIWFNIWKKKESELSILFKITTNYVQTATAAVSFNVTYPKAITSTFSVGQVFGQTTDTIISFDCFLASFNSSLFANSIYILKTFISCLLPLLIAFFFILVFCFWKLIRRKKTSLIRNIVVTFITTIFFLYPSLTEKSFGLLRCVKIYETNWL